VTPLRGNGGDDEPQRARRTKDAHDDEADRLRDLGNIVCWHGFPRKRPHSWEPGESCPPNRTERPVTGVDPVALDEWRRAA
jgi:hypothetical protein